MQHLTLEELEAGLDNILQSPKKVGKLELIVRRPDVNEREILALGEFDTELGLIGDNWSKRPSSRTPDRSPHPQMQINIMNSRCIGLIAQSRHRWQLAGDQLYADMDLSKANLPPGTRLSIGTAILEVTEQPHTGCKKFAERFGIEAMKFISSERGKALNLRGINAKVIEAGTARVGDFIVKVER